MPSGIYKHISQMYDNRRGKNHFRFGKTHNKETIDKMKKNNSMKRPEIIKKWLQSRKHNGKPWFSLNTRIAMSKTRKGRMALNKGKKQPQTTGELNPSKRPEVKEKQRISAINYIKNIRGFISPNIGKHEKQILDLLENYMGFKIHRQYPIIGYYVDGYIPELNLVIEIDESPHYNIDEKLRESDIKRQKEIEQELECKFLRIKDKITCDGGESYSF